MNGRRTSLRKKAGLKGLTVTELAAQIGRSRTSVYRAWNMPNRDPGTRARLAEMLEMPR